MKEINVVILGVIIVIAASVAFFIQIRPAGSKRLSIASSREIQAKLMILEGDKVVDEVDLKDKFIFILKADGVYYGDTATPGIFKAEYSNLNALGEGHRKIIKEKVE